MTTPPEQAPLPEESYPMTDPVVLFVINGIRLSLSQNLMTKDQAVDKIRGWYPGAEILLDDDEQK